MSKLESREKIEKRVKAREMWLRILTIFALLVMVTGLALFIYFQTSYQTRIQLDTPANVRVEKLGDSVYLKFDKVKNATAYRYSIDNHIIQVGADDLNVDITALVESPKKYKISVQAIAESGFKNSEISYAEDFVVTKTLAQPIADIDKYDSKLVWVNVDGADMYEVTIIVNSDITEPTTALVSKNEFDISDIVDDYTKKYSFSVKALAENEYINQSASSNAVEHSLKGRLTEPTSLSYDENTHKLTWDAVENASTYTVVLSHGNLEPQKFICSSNYIYFNSQDVQTIGEYEVYVYANNVQSQGLDEEVTWFLASEKSEIISFSVYEKLATPNGLRYQMNGELVWFSWDSVPNAYSYTIELVNAESVAFYQKNTVANEINLRRDLEGAIGGDFRIRVKANGYGYYYTSDFSAIMELNVLDKFAPVQNIEVLENGKYLTFTAPAKSAVSNVKFAPKNGYKVVILDENDNEIYNQTIYSTLLDTSTIFTQPIAYKISINTNAYGYFRASEITTAQYCHQEVLKTPTNVTLYKQTSTETNGTGEIVEINTMKLSFTGDINATDYTLWFEGVEYQNILTNKTYSAFATKTIDDVNKVATLGIDISSFSASILGYDPLTIAKKYSAKVKCIGNVGDSEMLAGYKDSKFSPVTMFENKIKLQAPQVLLVENVDEEKVILYFSQIDNATSYNIRITSAISGVTSVMTSRLTTCNIHSIISAGNNSITLTAVGSGYYENSDPSETIEYNYEPILKAPNDVEITEETLEGNVHYYATFTTTRFAEYYYVDIRKTHELQTINGTKQAVELTGAIFETLSTKFSKGTLKTNCDITEYLTNNGFGKYEVKVRAVFEQPEVPETPFIYSKKDSNIATYTYFDQQPAPTNLAFDKTTKILTFTGTETAQKGYIIRVKLEQSDGSFITNEISTLETTVDLSETIAILGGVGKFTISAMTRKVDELFLGNSAWATLEPVEIRIKLADPTNFQYSDSLQEVSWTSDLRMEYEYLKLTFRNKSISYTLREITDDSFNLSFVSLREYIKQYGDGFYEFTVQSFSHKNMVDDSEIVTYTYTKYVQLDSPVLISVMDRNNYVEAKFATSENAKTYAIIAKLPTEEVWTKIKTNIEDNGEDEITVDIKAELSKLYGANKYDIAVIAETYDYFQESQPSNSLPFELWLKFSPPANLTAEYDEEQGKYYALWDAVSYAETYSFTVNERVIASDITNTKFDLTSVIGDESTGKFLLGVRVNATGYYYNSLYTTYDFYLSSALSAPTITYDDKTHKLAISKQGGEIGYALYIDYFATESALSSKTPTNHLEYENIQATIINLTNTMEITGLGIYVIKVKALGDGVYWQNSDWSEELKAYYTEPLAPLTALNVDKRQNGGQIENYIVITKPTDVIYENALIQYVFYEIDNIDSDIQSEQTPALTIVDNRTEFKIEGLSSAKYYKVVATILGVYDNFQIYSNNLTSAELNTAISALAYYVNSEEKSVNFSTFGNQLSAPIIQSIAMTAEKQITITFAKVLNAETYTLIVARQSKNAVIYEKVINAENTDATIGTDAITVTLSATTADFADEYDIYNIKLCANDVVDPTSEEIAYAKSPNTEIDFAYTTTLSTPTVSFYELNDGTLRIEVSNIEFATGYELELKVNGFAQIYSLTDTYIDFSSAQYGAYIARAKALGDEYHKNSDWSASEEYTYRNQLASVEKVEIISNGDVATLATRIYAQWNEVNGAKMYGVKVDKDGTKIGEYETNKTYYDLINIFKANGYGTYTVWAKTNSDGAYIIGESKYTKYDTYQYKGQFEVPFSFEITYDYNTSVYPTKLTYLTKFSAVSGAEKYIITIYANDEEKTKVKEFELYASALSLENDIYNADISEYLKNIDGGVYNATIKVAETSANLASEESESISFTNYHLYKDPSLTAKQFGERPFIRVSFIEISNANYYSLYVNDTLYEVNGEKFQFISGYIDISAQYLNIGQENTFILEIIEEPSAYYLNTYYRVTVSNFTFKLSSVENIAIEQTSKTQIADGENNYIWLSFDQVDYATDYELYIDNEKVETLQAGQEKYDISALFANRMPKDNYKIELIAIDSADKLTRSDSKIYTFDYTLQFSAPTNLTMSDDTQISATWAEPQNLQSFQTLATENSIAFGEQKYKIIVYYILNSAENEVKQIADISSNSYDLTSIVNEPGTWRIDVYASANGAFDESITCASTTYNYVLTLDAVQNVKISQDNGTYSLSFDKVNEYNYTYAKDYYLNNLYYKIYVNGGLVYTPTHTGLPSNPVINITNKLWGGDNIIYVITANDKVAHFIESEQSNSAECTYSTQFTTLFHAEGINDEKNNKQLFRFDSFNVNGMTSDEILDLTYTLSIYNIDGVLISTKDDYKAERYNSSKLQIDITSVINGQPGSYQIIAKINAYQKSFLLGEKTINFAMNESDTVTISYDHKLRADTPKLSLLVIDIDGNERDANIGLEMQEMWLTFDVKFSDAFLARASELEYTLLINDSEYYLTLPYSTDKIGQTVTASGSMVTNSEIVKVSTRVKITERTESSERKISLSFSIIELIEKDGFNIYKSGVINIKAKSAEQGYYLESTYQINSLRYDYYLRYKTPTGLEYVTRQDGAHYIKWDVPTHAHVSDYYDIIDTYNVTIESMGVIDESGSASNPHNTLGCKHSCDFTRDEIIVENGYLYYNIENLLFAGHNTISLKCNESKANYYLESFATTIENNEYYKKIKTPEFTVDDLDTNTKGNDNAVKGVKINIINYDNDGDYDKELNKVINYNSSALYRVEITSQSECKSTTKNPSQSTYMDYSVIFKVNKSGTFEIINGADYVLSYKIKFSTINNCGTLQIEWQFAEPGRYTYSITALGDEANYTLDSDTQTLAHDTTYSAPTLTATLSIYHYDKNNNEVLRTGEKTTTTRMSKIVLEWQTDLSYFYNAEYKITIVGSYNSGETNSFVVKITNQTSITFSKDENGVIFDKIMYRPANYTFTLKSLAKTSAVSAGASDEMTYYYASTGKKMSYNYYVQIDKPQELSIYETYYNQYIKVKIPQYLIDAGIQNNTAQITVSYKIEQLAYNVGETACAFNSDSNTVELGRGAEANYYYINVTNNLYPGKNKITLWFNEISKQYFTQSDSLEVQCDYIATLAQIDDERVEYENLYDTSGYVKGFALSFNNVNYNTHFAYRLDIKGIWWNQNFQKSLLLKSTSTYDKTLCYTISGDDSIAEQVSASGLRTRKGTTNGYTYSPYSYSPCVNKRGNYVMTFLVLIDGGLPDEYSIKITSIGELKVNSNSEVNPLLSDLSSLKKDGTTLATRSSEPKELSYIMKGILKQASLSIGVKNNGKFKEATSNLASNAVAYVYNTDNPGNSFSCLSYSTNQNSKTFSGKYNSNVYLKVTLPKNDYQATKYGLYWTLGNTSDSGYRTVLNIDETNGNYYESGYSEVEIVTEGESVVAYIDLVEIGALSYRGAYTFWITAINERTVGFNEYIYENPKVDSIARFANRFDKVNTPTLETKRSFKSVEEQYIEITNFGRYSLDKYNTSEYTIKVTITEKDERGNKKSSNFEFSNNSINSNYSAEEPYPYYQYSSLYIPYAYLEEKFEENGFVFANIEVIIYIDVTESDYLWDSDDSDPAIIQYKGYIEFPNFAKNEDEFNGGTYENPGSGTAYTEYTFGNESEIPTKITAKYLINANKKFLNNSKYKLRLKVWNSTNYKTLDLELGNNKSLEVFNIKDGTKEGILHDILETNFTYGEHTLGMEIEGLYYSDDKEEVPDTAYYYDKGTYWINFVVKYKLRAPTVEFELDNNNIKLNSLNIKYYFKGLNKIDNKLGTIYSDSGTYVKYDIKRNDSWVSRGDSRISINNDDGVQKITLNDENTGKFEAWVRLLCSNYYILDSDEVDCSQIVKSLPGVSSAYITIEKKTDKNSTTYNNVNLTIKVSKVKGLDNSVWFERGALDAKNFKFELYLINVANAEGTTSKKYTGSISAIQAQLNADFNSLMSNTSKNAFAPGRYYFKIRISEDTKIGDEQYRASDWYYVGKENCFAGSGSKYNANARQIKNTLKGDTNASTCKYTVAYTNWNSSSLTIVRNNSTYKGLVTGVGFNTIRDGSGVNDGSGVLTFLTYQAIGKQSDKNDVYINSQTDNPTYGLYEDWLSFTQTKENVKEQYYSGYYSGYDRFNNATRKSSSTYSCFTDTGSTEKWNLYLYVRIDEDALKKYFSVWQSLYEAYKIDKTKSDSMLNYIEMSATSTSSVKYNEKDWVSYAKLSTNNTTVENVPKRQRLSPVINLKASSLSRETPALQIIYGYDYIASWDNYSSQLSSYIKGIEVKYYFYYNSCNEANLKTPTYKDGYNRWVIPNHCLMNKRTGEPDISKTSYSVYLKETDDRWDNNKNGSFWRVDESRICVIVQVKSKSNEYDDSAIVMNNNWGANPFEKWPSNPNYPLPEYEGSYATYSW